MVITKYPARPTSRLTYSVIIELRRFLFKKTLPRNEWVAKDVCRSNENRIHCTISETEEKLIHMGSIKGMKYGDSPQNKISWRAQTSTKADPRPDPDPGDFQNVTGTSLSKDTSMINFHRDPISFSRYMSHIVSHFALLKNHSKVLTSGRGEHPKFNKFSLVYCYIFAKNFQEDPISSLCVKSR